MSEELHFGLLIPFKNHEDGLKAFAYIVVTFSSDPALKHFTEALEVVISDTTLEPCQTDPLHIIKASKKHDKVHPVNFTKKSMMSTNKLILKDAVDKRFL